MRCRVLSRDRVGTVRFLGAVEGKVGLYVGVELDQPVGGSDGSVSGVHYFDCAPGCGFFTKPGDVEGGDFPEESLGLSDDEL